MPKSNQSKMLLLFLVLGVIGALILGFTAGLAYAQNDDFTHRQIEYLEGGRVGTVYSVLDDEKARDNCVATFYPQQQLHLAGCLDAAARRPPHMP